MLIWTAPAGGGGDGGRCGCVMAIGWHGEARRLGQA